MKNYHFKLTTLYALLLMFTQPTNAQWSQIGSDINGEGQENYSGISISLSSNGNIIAIGAEYNNANGYHTGHARVFQMIAGDWTQIGNDIDGEEEDDLAGHSVALNSTGNILAVGIINGDGIEVNAGCVKVFEYVNEDWVQLGDTIKGEMQDSRSGYSVSLSSDGYTIAIGEPRNSIFDYYSGRTGIYQFSDGAWIQKGNYIDGEMMNSAAGWSVSLSADGSIVAIGERNGSGNGNYARCTRIFYFDSSENWSQMGQDIDGEADNDHAGSSVSLNSEGNIVAIGAPFNDGPSGEPGTGHTRVYKFTAGLWVQLGEDIDSEAPGDKSGFSVSLSSAGNIVAIGAIHNNGIGYRSGHVRIYQYTDTVWTQMGADIEGEEISDQSGASVSFSQNGDTLAIGAMHNDENGLESGHVRVFKNPPIISVSENAEKKISIFPNPTEGKIVVQGKNIRKIEIWNINGQIIKDICIVEKQSDIDLSNQSKGIYVIKVTTEMSVIVNKVMLK